MAIIRVGDDLIDEETGEYAGLADFKLPDALETESDLIGFMEALMKEESNLIAKKAELAAVVKNCESIIQRASRRIEWLRYKYEQNATAIAIAALPRRKDGSYQSKTWTCPWGKVSVRDVAGTLEISDPDSALEWCKSYAPEAIKVTEKVLVSPLKECLDMESFKSGDVSSLPKGINYIPERQSVTFTTIKERMFEDEA